MQINHLFNIKIKHLNMMILNSLFVFGLFLSACSQPTLQPTPSITQIRPTITNTATPVPTLTNTPPPTTTPPPTATPVPTQTYTPTPTKALLVTNAEQTYVFIGPGGNYGLLGIYTKGFELEVVGRNDEATWLMIIIPPEQQGWISKEEINITVDINSLKIYSNPPTPQPTPRPGPTLSISWAENLWRNGYKYSGYFATITGLNPREKVKITMTRQNPYYSRNWTLDADQLGIFTSFLYVDFSIPGIYLILAQLEDGTILSGTIQI